MIVHRGCHVNVNPITGVFAIRYPIQLIGQARYRLCYPRRFQSLWILGSPGYQPRKLPEPLPYYIHGAPRARVLFKY